MDVVRVRREFVYNLSSGDATKNLYFGIYNGWAVILGIRVV